MSRFASMKAQRAPQPAAPPDAELCATPAPRAHAVSRIGKKAVSGYFSAEASLALHMLALELGTSLQALMGEAFDDLMRKYGRHPFGER